MTIGEILDDRRVADEALRRFEFLYSLPSKQFFELYNKVLLDTSERLHELSQWADFYKLRQRRMDAFNRLSKERIAQWRADGEPIRLERREPVVEPVPSSES